MRVFEASGNLGRVYKGIEILRRTIVTLTLILGERKERFGLRKTVEK